MSELENLIQRLCPDGVEYKTVGEICDIITGGEPPEDSIKSKLPQEDYIYPIYSNGIGFNALWGYAKSYRIESKAVTFSSIGTIGYPTLRDGKFTPIIRLKVIIPKNGSKLNIGFLKYVLEIVDFKQQKSSVPNVNAKMIANIKIPVPPIEVQREIVRILDNFSALTAELVVKLTEELETRKKQYEYYRDKLLSFDDIESGGGTPYKVEWKKLGEIFYTRNGYTPSKNNKAFWSSNEISWFRMEDIRENGRILDKAMQGVSKSAIKGKAFPANSIIVSTSATIGEHALIKCESLANQRFTYLMLKNEYKDKYNIMFLFYYCFVLDEFCKANLNQGNFASVDMRKFNDFEFPIPPLSEQERIVKILDRFDKLCNDISQGLPAEIEARKKQYEYYRDKLLNFKELAE